MKKYLQRGVMGLILAAIVLSPTQPLFASLVSPDIVNGVFSAGNNSQGALGAGMPQYQTLPQEFQLPGSLTVKKVLMNESSIFVLASDDQVYGSGRNVYGELGNGNRNMQRTPVRFQLPAGLTAVSMNMYQVKHSDFDEVMHVLASDGNVYSAGSNYSGQLGAGLGLDNISTPVRFQLPIGVTALEVHPQWRSVFVKASDGKVYAAGTNTAGELGNGTNVRQNTPVVFQLPAGVSAVKFAQYSASNRRIGSVVGSDGKLYSAGERYNGEFGDGVISGNAFTPVAYQLPAGVSAVSATIADGIITAVGSDGQLYGAGYNGSGILGNGNTTNQSIPVRFQLPAGLTVKKYYIDVYAYTQMVLANDDQLYGAGDNSMGQLGIGAASNSIIPVRT